MRKPYDPLAKAMSQRSAEQEWDAFAKAIQVPRPAIETFTKEALMLIHLSLGAKALRAALSATPRTPEQP